jgi:hypothetical protein
MEGVQVSEQMTEKQNKGAKARLVAALAGHLREVDFSWFELEEILRLAMFRALRDTGTRVIDKGDK